MSDRISLTEAWATLPYSSRSPYALLEVAQTAAGPLHAGVDDTGRRLLLVPAPCRLAHLPGPFPVLHLDQHNVVTTQGTAPMLVLRCEDGTFWDEFILLAEEVVNGIQDEADPARRALAVIDRWRRLLATARTNRLGQAQRMGLFAELMLLKSVLARRPELGSAIWTGPEGHPHDISLPGWDIEVKAVGITSSTVHIHGLHQLEVPANGRLSLAVCVVLEDAEGVPVRSLVEDIEAILGTGSDLRQRAERVGWSPIDLDQRFTGVEWIFIDIDEDIPRLVCGDLVDGGLRPGIVNLTYDIDLMALRTKALPRDLPQFATEVTE